MNAADVGRFIAVQRKKKTLTQKELAAQLNVTDKAVSKWETGKCYPDIEMIEKLSEIFEVSINEILSGKRIEPENQMEEAERNVIRVMKASENNQRKWKTVSLLFILITIGVDMILVVFSVVHEREDHQELTCAEAAFDEENIGSTVENEKIFDTGFSLTVLKDKQFRIDNQFTGYSETFRSPAGTRITIIK